MSDDAAPVDDIPSLEGMICFDVYALQHALAQAYKPLLAPLGITYPQYLVMVMLWEVRQASVGEIGRRLELETSTLTPLLKRIEKADLLVRERDPADERRVLVSLTARGERLAERARGISTCLINATGMTAAELLRFHQQIRTVRASLLDYGQGYDAAPSRPHHTS